MHVHASVLDFMVFAAFTVILGFLWRLAAAKWSDKPVGKAMAFLN